MFGLTNASPSIIISRSHRPNLDPLTGGYRRIPVAQIGPIFCDTQLIAEEVADLQGIKVSTRRVLMAKLLG